MKIDRAGIPFIAAAGLPALGFALFGLYLWAAPFAVLGLAMVFFFRDPDRAARGTPHAVIAPADGRVMVAGAPSPNAAPTGEWTQLSIFLSPLDVHVNRMPVTGRVARVEYKPGSFRAAYRPEATNDNERSEIWVDTEFCTVVFRQITGVLVRRVVCRARPGDHVQAGDRFGVMKFGSRIDLFLPVGTQLLVGVGDRVRAGETVVAELDVERRGHRAQSSDSKRAHAV
jgi:phosphatidylserine decarboxylase